MPTKKKEAPVEGEVVEEVTEVKSETSEYSFGRKRGGAGLFWGTIFLFWGLAILADTYWGTKLTDNLLPILAVAFGVYLITSSFKR